MKNSRYLQRAPMRVVCVLLLTLIGSFALVGQSEHPLTGRHIAPVMGASGADWLERSERDSEEAPEAALNLMDIQKGMTVADVGAGTGFFTEKLARRVGPEGKIYATDIQPEMVDHLHDRIDKEHLSNVEAVLSSENDPKLPAGKVDLILLVDVYHEFSQPQAMLQKLREALKPNGRLVLLEYRKEDPSIPIRPEHKMSVWEVRTEVQAEGFRFEKVLDTLPRQHLFVFRKSAN